MQRVEKMRHLLIAGSLLVSSPALAADIRSECKQMKEIGETHISEWFEKQRKAEAYIEWRARYGSPAFSKCYDEFKSKTTSRYVFEHPKFKPCEQQELARLNAPPKPEAFDKEEWHELADKKIVPFATLYSAFCKR